jgi:hypothetical protein
LCSYNKFGLCASIDVEAEGSGSFYFLKDIARKFQDSSSLRNADAKTVNCPLEWSSIQDIAHPVASNDTLNKYVHQLKDQQLTGWS